MAVAAAIEETLFGECWSIPRLFLVIISQIYIFT